MRVEPSEGFRREASRRISANRSRVIDQWKANKEWFCKPHSRMSDDEIEEQGSRLLSYLIHFLEKGEKESLFDYAREEVKLRVSKGYRPEEVEDVMRFWNYLIIRTLRPEFRREECRETFAELVSKVFDEILDIVSMEAKKLYVSNLEALVEERTKELRESEEKFRNIFESANDGLACLDMSGKIVDVNERAAEIFGSSKKELVGKHSAELGMVFSETWSLFVNGLEQTLPGNAPLLNVTIRNAKGRDVDLECSASLLGNSEKPSGVLMVARDVTDRKRAEEAIKASEEQYRRLVQHSKDGILEVNLDGSVTFANPACKEIFGYSPEEFTANPDLVAQILHPDYVERFKEFWQKFRDEGRFSEEATEWCWIHKNGHTVYTENIFANLLNEKGDVIGFQSIARDITQRKQVQEALRRSEKEYRDLVDNALVGVFKTNLDGELLFANEAVLKILGYESPEESISEGIIARYKDVKRREELLRKLSKHGKVSDFEIEILTKTGETRHIIMSATLQGDIISGMLTDITERKKAEEELRRNEERLKILFENAPDACVLIDEEGAFVDGNKAAVEIFGYPKDEGRGKTIFNIGVLPPEEVSRAATNLTRTLKGEPTGPDEFVLIRRDGKRIVAEAKAYPVKIEGRDLILVTARDITDRKKAEEAKDRLLSNISHELRTPLTSIEGYTKFLLSGKIGALSRKQEKCLRIVNEESERLKGLIDNFLDLITIDAEGLKMNIKRVDVARIIENLVSSMEIEIEKKEISLSWQVPKELGHVRGDEGRLHQLFSNLLTNAIKFTQRGGTIEVRTREEDSSIVVEVADSGIGIPQEELPHVFERFYQVDSSPTRRYRGIGLGLAICNEIVEAHGGHIEAESIEGKGSVFRVTLPRGKVAVDGKKKGNGGG